MSILTLEDKTKIALAFLTLGKAPYISNDGLTLLVADSSFTSEFLMSDSNNKTY